MYSIRFTKRKDIFCLETKEKPFAMQMKKREDI